MLAWGSCGRNQRKESPERDSKGIFNLGKPSSITFNVGAPTFWGRGRWYRSRESESRPPGLDSGSPPPQRLLTGLSFVAPLALVGKESRSGLRDSPAWPVTQ